jgi:hypothetical protein
MNQSEQIQKLSDAITTLVLTLTEIMQEQVRAFSAQSSIPAQTPQPQTETENSEIPAPNNTRAWLATPKNKVSKAGAYIEALNSNGFTTQPATLGNCKNVLPEFGRFQDVQRLFGIKRATVYSLIADGVVKSVSLRRRGNLKGVRLVHLQSLSEHLNRMMEEQEREKSDEAVEEEVS